MWLETLGVALVQALKVGDHAAGLAVGINPRLGLARPSLHPPARIALTCVVPDVARLIVADVLVLDPRGTAEFIGQRRGRRQAYDLVLTGLEDMAELAGRCVGPTQ